MKYEPFPMKTTDITKLAYKYSYKQTDGGKFSKEMKADINALYIFPKGEHTFLEIQYHFLWKSSVFGELLVFKLN